MVESQPPPKNVQAELAKERNRAAAERTLMAWIRTALSLISFGFGIDSIVRAIEATHSRVNPHRLSAYLGLAFISLGVYAMVTAAIDHRKELSHIENSVSYVYESRRSLAVIVAVCIVVIGVGAFIGVFVRSIGS